MPDYNFKSQLPIAQIAQLLAQKPVQEQQMRFQEDQNKRAKLDQLLNVLTTGAGIAQSMSGMKTASLQQQQLENQMKDAQAQDQKMQTLGSVMNEPSPTAAVTSPIRMAVRPQLAAPGVSDVNNQPDVTLSDKTYQPTFGQTASYNPETGQTSPLGATHDQRLKSAVFAASPKDALEQIVKNQFPGRDKFAQAQYQDPSGKVKLAAFDSNTGKFSPADLEAAPKGVQSAIKGASLDTATPQEQGLAKAMVEGNVRPSDIGFRDRGRIVSMAQEYATKNGLPFQSYGGDVKAGMAKNLAYGKFGQNTLALNTGIGHATAALDAYDKLGNTDVNLLNQPINYLKTKTNDPNIIALDENLIALQGEAANIFKSSGGTDQEISKWQNVLNSNLTPVQAQAAISKFGELLQSRLDAMSSQQQNVMQNSPSGRTLLSPKSQKNLDKLKSGNKSKATMRWNPATQSLEPI